MFNSILIPKYLIVLLVIFPISIFGENLQQYIDLLYRDNPEIKSDSLKYSASVFKEGTIGWQDPKLSLAFLPSPIETRLGSQQGKIALLQSLPRFNELDLKREKADLLKQINYSNFIIKKMKLKSKLLTLWYSGFTLDKVVVHQENKISLLKSVLDLSLKGVESGEKSSSEYLQTDIKYINAVTELQNLLENIELNQTSFNLILNRERSITIPYPERLSYYPDSSIFRYSSNSPLIDKRDREKMIAALDKQISKLEYQPKFTLGAEYIFINDESYVMDDDGGKDGVALMATFNLPIFWGTKDSGIEQSSIKVEEKKYRVESVKLDLKNRVERLKSQYISTSNTIQFLKNRLSRLKRIIDIKNGEISSGKKLAPALLLKLEVESTSIQILKLEDKLFKIYYKYLELY